MKEVSGDLYEVVQDHWCTPGCDEGCRISKTRYFRTKTEIIETRPELTEEDHEYIRNFIAKRRGDHEGS